MVTELDALLRLTVAAGLGALVGVDREARDKPAGLRTFSIVATGSCLFTLVGTMAFGNGDPGSRVASTIVTGVGFLGAGTILHRRSDVIGLTTAAGIWGAAAVGMAAGMGLYVLAGGGALLILAILWILGTLAHPREQAVPDDARDAEPSSDPSGATRGMRDGRDAARLTHVTRSAGGHRPDRDPMTR